MPTIDAEEVRTLTTGEYAELGKQLAKAYGELAQMKKDAKDAMQSLKEGIDEQEMHVWRLANQIRTGQKELNFGDGVQEAAQRLKDSCPEGASMSIQLEGLPPVVIADKRPKNGANGKPKGKDRKSKAAGE